MLINFCIRLLRSFPLAALCLLASMACAGVGDTTPAPRVTSDWPQWRGPNRDSISPETGLALDWRVAKPKPLWQVNVGLGYSSMAVANGKLYTQGWNWRTCEDAVVCLNAVTGKLTWKYSYPAGSGVWVDDGRGHIPEFMGPRATPAVDGHRVYTMGADGQAYCFDADSGKVIWQRRFEDLNVHLFNENGYWLSASPLVVGNIVILGSNGGCIAVDKVSGATRWNIGREGGGLSSPVFFQYHGQPSLLTHSSRSFYAVNLATGKPFWKYTWGTGGDSADPLVIGDYVLFCGAYARQSFCITIGTRTPVWRGSTVIPEVCSPILYNGLIYCETGYGNGPIACLDPATGKQKFLTNDKQNFVNHIIVDGKLIATDGDGRLSVYDILPDRFQSLGHYTPPIPYVGEVDSLGTIQPVLAQGRLYLRSWRGALIALDVTGNASITPPPLKPLPVGIGLRFAEWPYPASTTPPPPYTKPTASDWSQWRGARRDGTLDETDFVLKWIAVGPPPLRRRLDGLYDFSNIVGADARIYNIAPASHWRLDVGYGFSSIVGTGDRIYTTGWRQGEDYNPVYVWCLDARTGRTIWQYQYTPRETGAFLDKEHGNTPRGMGPRATPLLDGDKLYIFSMTGDVSCLNAVNGDLVWTKCVERDLPEDNNVKRPAWQHAGCPIIVGDAIIVNAGTAGVALNKLTGAFLWSTGATAGGQGNPVFITQHGKACVAMLGATALNIVDPVDGKVQWSYPWPKADYPVIADPVVIGDKLLLTNSAGGVLIAPGSDKPLWSCAALRPKVGSPIFYQGYVYCANQPDGELVCVSAADGTVKWRAKLPVSQLLLAGSTLLLQGVHGDITLATATPDGYKPLGSAKFLDSDQCWISPAIINGRLFCRGWEGELACVDLKTQIVLTAPSP